MSSITFVYAPVAPFRLDLTVWALRRRAENAIDRWDGQTYQRVLVLDGGPVEVAAIQTGLPNTPQLAVTAVGAHMAPGAESTLLAALERILGLRTDLETFYRFAATDAQLSPLVQRFRGMKPPRFPTVFEAVANAIACQQITLTLGIHLLNRLATAYGGHVEGQEGAARAFPQPDDLAPLEVESLKALGLSHQKSQALIELARAIIEGRLDLEGLSHLDDATAVARLQELRGVGRWTAEYVLLRGLGRLHVFPGDDVGARNNLRRWLSLREPLDYVGVSHVLTRWKAYSGLIYLHLLLDRLAEGGYL
jgi:DNA-3-methyladenine glycosylase II